MRWVALTLVAVGSGLLFLGYLNAQEKEKEKLKEPGQETTTATRVWPGYGHSGISVNIQGSNNNVTAHQCINYNFNYYVKTGCGAWPTSCAPVVHSHTQGYGPPMTVTPIPQGNPGMLGGLPQLPGAIVTPSQGPMVPAAPGILLGPLQQAPPAWEAPRPSEPQKKPADLDKKLPAAPALEEGRMIDPAAPIGLGLAGAGLLGVVLPGAWRRETVRGS